MILGLTGFSGAGKSTVASLLKEQGFYHLDCDALVHREVYRDPEVLAAIERAFPGTVREGALDRPALRSRTMGEPEMLEKLNNTVMPFILAHIQAKLEKHSGSPIVLDAPLLFESGLDQKCDKVLSVITSRERALQRIMERDTLTAAEAEKRLASQHPATYYIEKSDFIINNDEGIQALKEALPEVLKQLYDKTL